ncbi:MAG: lipopolysaccharide heptosyltransferase II, partial [Deltaproteobacteria bacterium]|nr:lipopolysaccharide heptosyltransferase II [Deltaproteobacteria bacterium]
RILVRAPNWIGDAVLSLPALSALKALFPGSEVFVLAKARVVPVFGNNPDVAGIITYDDNGRHKGIKGKLKLGGELKAEGFALAVLFQNAFDAAFVTFISGIPERVGYARDLRSPLLTRAINVSPEIKKRHQVFYYLNIIKELGGAVPERPEPHIHISGEEMLWAEGFLKDNGLEKADLIGAAPGASYGRAKRWPAKGFAEALNKISESCKGVSLVFGGPEDREACEQVSGMLKGRNLNLAGKISLRQFMALLCNIRVFITNDSGPMHISAALNVPTVAIFGSTDPALTGPLGQNSKVVIKKAGCSPCFKRACRFGHYDCLNMIEADEVASQAVSLLKELN